MFLFSFSFSNVCFFLCCLYNWFFFQSIGCWIMVLNVILPSSQSSKVCVTMETAK